MTITGNVRFTASNYLGNMRVDIRKFFKKDGVDTPTTKGISLSVEQWQEIVARWPEIVEEIEKRLNGKEE